METLEHEDVLQKYYDQYFDNLTKLEEAFPQQKLEEAVDFALAFLFKSTEEMKERAFREYKIAASKGLPLKERESLVDWKKVRWCDEEIKRLTELKKTRKVLAFKEWLAPEDFGWIKRGGLREFLRFNVERVIENYKQKI